MESASSSFLSSRALTDSETASAASGYLSTVILSFSTSLTAEKRLSSFPSRALAASAMTLSMSPSKWTGLGTVFLPAASSMEAMRSSTPLPVVAEMGTTLHPSSLESLSTSILSPCLSIMSIMLRAMTVGSPMSRICRERKRFLSRLVASTMLRMASGLFPFSSPLII